MRASDLGGDSLTVQWSLLMIPPGSLAMLRAPTAVMSILVGRSTWTVYRTANCERWHGRQQLGLGDYHRLVPVRTIGALSACKSSRGCLIVSQYTRRLYSK